MSLTEQEGSGDASGNVADGHRPRRRWPWVVSAIGVVLLLAVALVWTQSHRAELTSLGQDQVWGLYIEVDYAPLLPASVTGAHLQTDAGDDEGGLYDSSRDDDMPPEQVTARVGHPVTLSFSIVPTCDGQHIDDEGTISVQTTSGDRAISIALPGLAAKVADWCGGDLALNLSTAQADADGRNVVAVYRVVSPRDVVVTVTSPGWQAEPLTVADGETAELTVSSVAGCTANGARLALTATYPDGTKEQAYAPAPGNQVCES